MVLMSKSTDSSEDTSRDNMDNDRSSTLRPKQIGPLEIAAEQASTNK